MYQGKIERMSLEKAIRTTQIAQDVELAEAITRLKSNPAELRAWLQSQQDKVYNTIVAQKENTFDKVYGDLNRASKVEESILMHNKRASELSEMIDNVYENQETSAKAVLNDKNLASRKNEMNEWTVGNKQDTLFVFSSLFIMLSGLLLITGLWRLGMISSYLWVAFAIPLLLIFILILLRRWRYTDVLRNKRYWNKQIFEGKYKKIAIPSCPQMMEGIEQTLGQTGTGASVMSP
jgi:heme exporter protein D